MGMMIGGAAFSGPHTVAEVVLTPARPGVFVVVCKTAAGAYRVLDVDCCDDATVRLAEHARQPCWDRHCDGQLFVYVRHMPHTRGHVEGDWRELEQAIRARYPLRCGVEPLA